MIMSSLFFAFATAGFPAVVNPVVPDPDADVISLRGEWEFRTAPYLNRLNLFEPYFHAVTNGWEKRIQVPGCWEAQGIVGEAGESCGWDIVTDNSPKPIRNLFMGVGQYRREVEIPAAWRGRRIWLKVGGVKSDSRDEAKYCGAWLPPVPRKSRAEWLARFGIDHEWGDRIQDAQHVLQGVYLKQGLESARLDPYCDGYCFWTIADVVVRSHLSYSAQGLLNPFWEEKRRGFRLEDVALLDSLVGYACSERFTPKGRVELQKLNNQKQQEP